MIYNNMKKKKIALIAHDGKKLDIIQWCNWNKETLKRNILVGTSTTASLIQSELGFEIEKVFSGAKGGDAQISAMMVNGEIDFVVFFIDPMSIPPHFEDVRAFIRLAILYNIPIAFNRQTADAIITSNLFTF